MKYDGETESKHETHGAAKVGYQFTYYWFVQIGFYLGPIIFRKNISNFNAISI
jgi:hypothetical protein